MKLRQPDLLAIIAKPNACELNAAVLFPLEPESVEVAIGPPYGDLDGELRIGDGARASNRQTTSNHWAYAQQRDI